MPGHDIIVMGASAGGLEALVAVVRGLPGDLPAALFVVLHVPPEGRSMLPAILNRAGTLLALHPTGAAPIRHGCIYVAPPDQHLLIRRGWVQTHRGPRENGHRPAIDPLFRSAAMEYGAQAVGVVLSGTLDDGTQGLVAIKQRGGVAVVQDPDEALYPGMSLSALQHVPVDHCLRTQEIATLLLRLATEAPSATEEVAGAAAEASTDVKKRDAATPEAREEAATMQEEPEMGTPSVYSCPECSGVLWETREGELVRFRCRVGHAYSPDSMASQQDETLERTLWSTVKILEEKISLARRLARRAELTGNARTAARHRAGAEEAVQHAARLREMLLNKDASEAE